MDKDSNLVAFDLFDIRTLLRQDSIVHPQSNLFSTNKKLNK